MIRKCALCDGELNPESHTTYRKISGWERKRGQGGTNHVALKTQGRELAHDYCVEREAKKVSARQASLL